MKKKTSLYIESDVWKKIKTNAIKLDKTLGEFVTMLYQKWKEGQNADSNTIDKGGRT